jgi:electron transfer flavoprotein beta subunit
MTNMRTIMPALQKSKPATLSTGAVRFLNVNPPKQQRQTRIVKDRSPEDIAAELLEWIAQE